jgi:manganese/iron transport system substrate-binding protein
MIDMQVGAHHRVDRFTREAGLRQVAKETGASYGGVLYVDSLTGPDGPAPTFLRLLETNADTLVKGFLKPE